MFLQSFRKFSLFFSIFCICPFFIKRRGTDFIVHQSRTHVYSILLQSYLFFTGTAICAYYGYFKTDNIHEYWDMVKTSGYICHAAPILITEVNVLVIFITTRQHATIFRKIDFLERKLYKHCDISIKFDGLCRQSWLEIIISILYANILLIGKLHEVYASSKYVIIYKIILTIVDLIYILILCHFSFIIRTLTVFVKSVRIVLATKHAFLCSQEYSKLFRSLNGFYKDFMKVKKMIDKILGSILSIDITYDFFVFTFLIYLYLRSIDTCDRVCTLIQIFQICGKSIKIMYFTEQVERCYREVRKDLIIFENLAHLTVWF